MSSLGAVQGSLRSVQDPVKHFDRQLTSPCRTYQLYHSARTDLHHHQRRRDCFRTHARSLCDILLAARSSLQFNVGLASTIEDLTDSKWGWLAQCNSYDAL